MDSKRDAAALVGRILIASLFLWSSYGKIVGFEGSVGYIASKNLPMPQVLAALSLAVELLAGLAIAFGFKTRIAAALLFLWLIPATFLFHNFWSSPPDEVMMQQINFYKNLATMGGVLLLWAFGPGRYSVDKA